MGLQNNINAYVPPVGTLFVDEVEVGVGVRGVKPATPAPPPISFCTIVIWLILPVVICLSQRLSHACLSISNLIQRNCVQLIISAIIYLKVTNYMDNRGNSRANTCNKVIRKDRCIY